MFSSDTCKRLQIAAAAKFGKIEIQLYESAPTGVYLNGDQIDVLGMQFYFRFLRCFGVKISHITFSFMRYDRLDRYINRYCVDTLTKIFQNYLKISKKFTSSMPIWEINYQIWLTYFRIYFN